MSDVNTPNSSITPVFVPNYQSNLLAGNTHHYGPNGRIQGVDFYRVAMTVIVPAEPSDARTDLEDSLREDHRRPGQPYGLALLESQQFGVMLLTEPSTIEAFRSGTAVLPGGADATIYGGWPSCGYGPWEKIIPAATWYPGGTGILDEFEGVDGAKVTLYEYTVDEGLAWNRRGTPTGKTTAMVGWHCDRCHRPYEMEFDERFENRGPHDRQWAGRNARGHARGQDGKCRPPRGDLEELVSAVASDLRGYRVEVPSQAASCAAEEGCARVRHARAVTARLASAAGQTGR
ncbi:hypothetical protein OOJ91_33565 [Micromonospora lupini]|uniref:hypothetical protein n=1 Tax=Micromonospora lupini TaxID=285679 RepID=UPI00225594F4|nr:hypothetical protein [Micromonospora lupini]MCX5070775.1 hypothetical protein [Micromonospora lupini]